MCNLCAGRSMRLLAKQLYQEELTGASHTEERSPRTPRRSAEMPHAASPGSARTPSQVSVHSHFIDSRQLGTADSATDVNKSLSRKSPMRSPSRQDVAETVRRSPRLIARQDNLLLSSPAASAPSVCTAYMSTCFTLDSQLLLGITCMPRFILLCINGASINLT